MSLILFLFAIGFLTAIRFCPPNQIAGQGRNEDQLIPF
jgi:hypothetical protein